MGGSWIGRVERGRFERIFGDGGSWRCVEDFGPADIGIKESPPHAVVADDRHASATVEEGS